MPVVGGWFVAIEAARGGRTNERPAAVALDACYIGRRASGGTRFSASPISHSGISTHATGPTSVVLVFENGKAPGRCRLSSASVHVSFIAAGIDRIFRFRGRVCSFGPRRRLLDRPGASQPKRLGLN